MKKENPGSSPSTTEKCYICNYVGDWDHETGKTVAELFDHRIVVVTEISITYKDLKICAQCKKAYDLGYKDGLDDSVG